MRKNSRGAAFGDAILRSLPGDRPGPSVNPAAGAPAPTSQRGARRMGQERFADVVERFTHGFGGGNGSAPGPEVLKQWQEELDRNVKRMENLHRMVTSPAEPRTGQTPREEIYKKNKSRLYRYQSKRTHRTPLLFVPNLGISRPYIFDLMPNGSFVEHMTREGFDFYMLDWGVFGPEDNGLTFEECVVKILPRMARKVLESSNAESLTGLGYCMGAPLSA
jgi:poly(3-hydroxyalkanoate) synthetase